MAKKAYLLLFTDMHDNTFQFSLTKMYVSLHVMHTKCEQCLHSFEISYHT